MQCHCAHRQGHTVTHRHSDTVHRQTDRQTRGPGRDTALGGTARTEAQGMLSDGTLPGNTQNAALGTLVPSLDPATITPH